MLFQQGHACIAGMTLDSITLGEQLRSKDAQIAKLLGTLGHYRSATLSLHFLLVSHISHASAASHLAIFLFKQS